MDDIDSDGRGVLDVDEVVRHNPQLVVVKNKVLACLFVLLIALSLSQTVRGGLSSQASVSSRLLPRSKQGASRRMTGLRLNFYFR